MLAMQSNNVINASNQATGPFATNTCPAMAGGSNSSSGVNSQARPENAQDKLRRLMVRETVFVLNLTSIRKIGYIV